MTSQINPSNIDGTYPIAGQDNNSQGFRTNFTNTSTNFQYAAQEITDLQSKAVLKSALSGTTLDNNMQGSPLSNAVLSDMAYKVVGITTTTGTIPVDYSAGPFQTVALSGPGSLSFSNWPASGLAGGQGVVTLQVTVSNTSQTLTLPTAVGSGASAASVLGIEGLSGQVITFAQTGTYTFSFSTSDAGTTIYIQDLTRPRSYFTNNVSMLGNLSVTGTISGNIAGNLTVGGANTQVLFNDSGIANATANLTFNKSTNVLTLTGSLSTGGNVVVSGNVSAGNISGNISTGSAISTTGNIAGGNILSGSLLSAAGTIATGTNIIALGSVQVGTTLSVTGTISAVGNVTTGGVSFLPSNEDLPATNAANLNVTTSYFTTGAAETATLPDGRPGQIKTLVAANVALGNMVVTATSPGWGGSGTITFSGNGQACTLLFVDGLAKWYCIGNNGAVFA